MYDVTTHERWFSPPRSPTIVGSAVDTMVWSSAASTLIRGGSPCASRCSACRLAGDSFPAIAGWSDAESLRLAIVRARTHQCWASSLDNCSIERIPASYRYCVLQVSPDRMLAAAP